MNKGRMEILAKLLDKLADKESEPLLGFNMCSISSRQRIDMSVHACGTSACIAGWAVAAFGTLAERAAVLSGDRDALYTTLDGDSIIKYAEQLLGLQGTYRNLFFSDFEMGPREAAAKIRRMVGEAK